MGNVAIFLFVFLGFCCVVEQCRRWNEKLMEAALELEKVRERRDQLEASLVEVVNNFNDGGVTFHNNAYQKLVTLNRARGTLYGGSLGLPGVKVSLEVVSGS